MLVQPVTINGMFYCLRRATYDAIGGFDGLESALVDDFAVARRLRAKGYRLVPTTVRNPTRIHVENGRAFLRMMHRWMIFARLSLTRELPLRELAIVYPVGAASILGPLLLLAVLAVHPTVWLGCVFVLYLAYHYLIFVHFNTAYLHRASPLSRSWLVVVMQLLLPLQLVVASVAPRRIYWRGQLIEVERGGSFRVLKRRDACRP
jgi:ceramide glucosyltransferase